MTTALPCILIYAEHPDKQHLPLLQRTVVNEKGRDHCILRAAPHTGDYISFAGQTWEVRHVIHADLGAIYVLVFGPITDGGELLLWNEVSLR